MAPVGSAAPAKKRPAALPPRCTATTRLSPPFPQTKNTKPTRLSAVLRNHRLAALSATQLLKGASWLARIGVDVAQFKSARQVLAAQNALVSFVNDCSPRTIVKNLRELDAATEEVDPGVIVVQVRGLF
jgi:hypothetical protein